LYFRVSIILKMKNLEIKSSGEYKQIIAKTDDFDFYGGEPIYEEARTKDGVFQVKVGQEPFVVRSEFPEGSINIKVLDENKNSLRITFYLSVHGNIKKIEMPAVLVSTIHEHSLEFRQSGRHQEMYIASDK